MNGKHRIISISLAIALTVVMCALWFPLVTSGNLRADSERMLHHPEVALSQYISEARTGLVALLRLFGLDRWNPLRSGALFLTFFIASAWVICGFICHFSGKGWRNRYLIFLLLYTTSPVWAFQAYFVLQIAGVGFAMLLMALVAGLDAMLFMEYRGSIALKCGGGILRSAAELRADRLPGAWGLLCHSCLFVPVVRAPRELSSQGPGHRSMDRDSGAGIDNILAVGPFIAGWL